jgi:hypothetical protein
MRRDEKSWSLYVFSSANTLERYSMEEIVGLGISWVWLGLEGKESQYAKLRGVGTRALVRRLQDHGVRVLGSSIIGLLAHTPENVDEAIEHAVAHDTEFHQFMLYTPLAGTPLWREHLAEGTLLSEEECPDADAHGQHRFNFRHPHIPAGQETEMLLRAFRRDFEVNGPSVTRIARTLLRGWLAHKDHPEVRVRRRFEREARDLVRLYPGVLWASEKWLRGNRAVAERLGSLRRAIGAEFGWKARVAAPAVGAAVLAAMAREAVRLRLGATYEPPTYFELNEAAARLETAPGVAWAPCRYLEREKRPDRPARRAESAPRDEHVAAPPG